ncbi:MAG TPA: hypothetical protein VES95_00515 [Dermatophilaceae bacterium]|nr:hypothetical protein [Dermatophilaceae bacterium]
MLHSSVPEFEYPRRDLPAKAAFTGAMLSTGWVYEFVPPAWWTTSPRPGPQGVLERFVPLTELLPHTDVMVTIGGFGGPQPALAHGVPLVAAGKTEDKMRSPRAPPGAGPVSR